MPSPRRWETGGPHLLCVYCVLLLSSMVAHTAERKLNISRARLRNTVPTKELEIILRDSTIKWCRSCHSLKPTVDFYASQMSIEKLTGVCKLCLAERAHNFWLAHSADPEWRRRWNIRAQRTRDKLRKENPQKAKDQHKLYSLRELYGINLNQFNIMFERQNGCCAICQKPFPTRSTAHVDHDHSSYTVRGLLCNNCNNGLGRFYDDPEILRSGARYIDEHNRRTVH